MRILSLFMLLLSLGMGANAQSEEEVFVMVEQVPEFPGGKEAMYKYLINNIQYPEEARELGITGTVYVQFIVEKDGRITNVKVVRGVHKALDNEAKRVVEMMPDWKPGVQRGKAVRTQFTMPIKFILRGAGNENKSKEKPIKWWQFWK